MNDFIRCQPLAGLCDDEDGGYGRDLMVSDDEDLQPEQKLQGERSG